MMEEHIREERKKLLKERREERVRSNINIMFSMSKFHLHGKWMCYPINRAHRQKGQMGLSEEDQRKALVFRLQMNGDTEELSNKLPKQANETAITNSISTEAASCSRTSSCCQNGTFNGKSENHNVNLEEQESQKKLPQQRNKESKPSSSTRKMSTLPTWFESWEREDTYAALAVVTAIASVAVAYSCYRQLR